MLTQTALGMTAGATILGIILFLAGIIFLVSYFQKEVSQEAERELSETEKATRELLRKNEEALFRPVVDGPDTVEFFGLHTQIEAELDTTKGFVWYRPKTNEILLQCVSNISDSANLYSTKCLTQKGYVKLGEY